MSKHSENLRPPPARAAVWGDGPNGQSGSAFLLAVLAILLLGFSVVGGLRYVGPKVTLSRQQSISKQTTDLLRPALSAFVVRNYRLPCPADGSVAAGAATEGVENCTSLIATPSRGVVPWRTLGLQSGDGLDTWGARIGYAVSPGLMTGTPFKTSPPTALDAIMVTVNGVSAANRAYVLISFGADQMGAYLTSGSRVSPPTGAKEAPNAAAPFNNFVVWPTNTSVPRNSASYFDDWMVFESSAQICADANFNKPAANWTVCTSGNNTGPAPSSNNSSNNLISGNPSGGNSNAYACPPGSAYCPGSFNAGSAANTSSFVGSGNRTVWTPGGSTATLVGNVGFVSVGGAGSNGISIGNSLGQANGGGDWIGAASGTACPNPYAGSNPNYMPPGQPLMFQFTTSYPAFTFVDFIPDGGTQLQVDGYTAPVVSFTGNVSDGLVNITGVSTASNSQKGACGINISAPVAASLLTQGQNIAAGNDLPSGTTISGIVGTQVTASAAPTVQSAIDFLVAAPAGTTINNGCTGDVSASTVITNVSCATWPTGGQQQWIAGPTLAANTTVSSVAQAAATITLSAAATAAQPGSPLFVTPAGAPMIGFTGTVTKGSPSITNVSSILNLRKLQVVAGPAFQSTINANQAGTTVTLATNGVPTDTGITLAALGTRSDFMGKVTANSTAMTNIANIANLTAVAPANLVGQTISGPGIRAGTTIVSGAGSSPTATLTLSQPATYTSAAAGAYYAVPWTRVGTLMVSNGHLSNLNYGISFTGNVSNGSFSITDVSSILGLTLGAPVAGQGIRPGSTIAGISGGTITMSQGSTFSGSGGETISFVVTDASCNVVAALTGTLSAGGNTITNVPSVIGLAAGQTIVGNDIPYNQPTQAQPCPTGATTISSFAGGTLTLSLAPAVVAADPGAVGVDPNAKEYAQTLFAAAGNFAPPPVTGNLTKGSPSVSGLSATAGLAVGQPIVGTGVPANTVISAVSATAATLTLSQNANVTATNVSLFASPRPAITVVTGTVTNGSSTVTVSSTAGMAVGQFISGSGIPSATTITAVNAGASTVTMSNAANALVAASQPEPISASSDAFTVTGNTTLNSPTLSNVSATSGFATGQSVIGANLPTGTTVTAINGAASTLTVSNNATATAATEPLTQPDSGTPLSGITGNLSCASNTNLVTNVLPATTGIAAGQAIASSNIIAGTTTTAVSAASSQITMSQPPLTSQTAAPLDIIALPRLTGITLAGTTDGSTATITGLSPNAPPAVGQAISGAGIPPGSVITAVDGTPTVVMSQNATTTATGTTLTGGFSGCSGNVTGDLTNTSPLIKNLSCIAGLAAGQSISASGIPTGTIVQAITIGPATLSLPTTPASGTITMSNSATAPASNEALTGAFSGCGNTNPTGSVTQGSPNINNVSCILGLGVGQTISGTGIPSGTTIQSITIGGATAPFSFSSPLYATYPSCPGPTKDYTAANGGAGNVSYTGYFKGGLYRAPSAYPQNATAPTTQHPSAAAANIAGSTQIWSQIWPQPGEANAVNPIAPRNLAGAGNYVGERDTQFDNRQFVDAKGNVAMFNILSFQILPYIYQDGTSFQYCMLFEGTKGCSRDIYTAACTFQGNDEWGNPPVAVTMNCNQQPW